jgi:hypothetical protein
MAVSSGWFTVCVCVCVCVCLLQALETVPQDIRRRANILMALTRSVSTLGPGTS